MGDHRRYGDRCWRQIEAAQHVDLLLDDQLFGQSLGDCRVCSAGIAIDDLDIVLSRFSSMLRDVGGDALLELLARRCKRARERADDADFDGVGSSC